MAKIPPESSSFPRRGAAFRGVGYATQTRQGLLWRTWPKKRGKPRSQAQDDAQTFFQIATQVVKVMDPLFIAWANEVSIGTPLLPRDMLMMTLYNRLGYIIMPDQTKVFSMAAYQDVSLLLDAIQQIQGGMMYRDQTFWKAIPPGLPGEVLTVGLDGIPGFSGGGGGGDFKVVDVFTYSSVPTLDVDLRPYLGSFRTLQLRVLNALPVNDGGGFYARIGTGSPVTWQSAAGAYLYTLGVMISLPASGFTGGSDTAFPFNGGNPTGNASDSGLSMTIESSSWDLGTKKPRWTWDLETIQNSGYAVTLWGSGYFGTAVQQTGMQFAFNNGDTAEATIEVIGIV